MKKIISTIITLFVAVAATAAPISEQQARQIATAFFSGGTRAGAVDVELAWSGSNLQKGATQHSMQSSWSDNLLYIYNRSDNPGFVIIAGDDCVQPIIAFADDRTFDPQNIADGARYLLSAWCKQIADTKGSGTSAQQLQMPTVGSAECLYNTALWNQGEPFNREAPVYNGYRSVTGCVATAMSILAYYYKWPDKGVGTTPAYTHQDEWGISRTVPSNTLGRSYDYNNMLMDYNGSYTSTQANAVAALMYDMGTAVKMAYSPSFSGTSSTNAVIALSKYFGYSKSALLVPRGNKTDKEWFSLLKENIKTYGPTFFAGDDTTSGHAFILDGYTSGNYFHINYGWGGYSNGYYWIPEIEYFNGQDAIFYLEPDKNGTSTYQDNLSFIALSGSTYDYYGLRSLASEHKTNETFKFILGGIYNSGSTAFNGQVQLSHCDKNGNVKGAFLTSTINSLNVGYYTYFDILSARTSIEIAEGDRIRLHYKGEYSNEWQWTHASDHLCVDEILLKATPEEVAKTLKISYSKINKSLTFTSPNAIQYTVKSATNSSIKTSGAVASYTPTTIDCSSFDAGEYHFEFASGGRPYILTIVL